MFTALPIATIPQVLPAQNTGLPHLLHQKRFQTANQPIRHDLLSMQPATLRRK